MAAVIDAQDYQRFIAGLPASLEPSLVSNEAMSTAFFKARQRGWLLEALIAEAVRQVEHQGGIGAIVSRFRALASTPPIERSGEQRPERVPYRRHDGEEPIPWEWHRERMELMRRIGKGGWTPDAAEREMTALIARQKASRDVDPFA